MSTGPSKSTAASIRQRLLNQARANNSNYNHLLIRYAIERLLYRLSVSPHRDAFVLKGAMLFAVWQGTLHRATQDLDLLGFGDRSGTRLIEVFRDLCTVAVQDDGLMFDSASVSLDEIDAVNEYGGVRVMLNSDLGGAFIRLQVDIGFGDAVTPDASEEVYPTLLAELPSARLRTYPRETVVAEKLEAIISLGMLNTRFKDYYDLLFLSENFRFDGRVLSAAIANTLERRGTAIPSLLPVGLSDEFANNPTKQAQWRTLVKRIGEEKPEASLQKVIEEISAFVGPILSSLSAGRAFHLIWTPGSGWGK